jgi:hypothetical protein
LSSVHWHARLSARRGADARNLTRGFHPCGNADCERFRRGLSYPYDYSANVETRNLVPAGSRLFSVPMSNIAQTAS